MLARLLPAFKKSHFESDLLGSYAPDHLLQAAKLSAICLFDCFCRDSHWRDAWGLTQVCTKSRANHVVLTCIDLASIVLIQWLDSWQCDGTLSERNLLISRSDRFVQPLGRITSRSDLVLSGLSILCGTGSLSASLTLPAPYLSTYQIITWRKMARRVRYMAWDYVSALNIDVMTTIAGIVTYAFIKKPASAASASNDQEHPVELRLLEVL